MKGKIIIEVMDDQEIADYCKEAGEFNRGISYNVKLQCAEWEAVEIVAGLANALRFNPAQTLLLLMRLTRKAGYVDRSQEIRFSGPMDGKPCPGEEASL